jgi:hypothetical protein
MRDVDEEGWTGTVLVEPLTALAGGIVGGAIIATIAWRYAWRGVESIARAHTTTGKALA